MIIVMVSVIVLSVLAGGFAYSMKVETRLAQNSNSEGVLVWLGRSGVEKARYILSQQDCPYDSLDQKWAGGGGTCSSNSPLLEVQMENIELGPGVIRKIAIVDLERKMNINLADARILQQAMNLVGVDPGDASAVIGSIQDWIDPDNATHVGGAESSYYEASNPPYVAKNGPIDDMSELLLIRGVTPEIFWGPSSTNSLQAAFQARARPFGPVGLAPPTVGLVDLFTPFSSGKININTASAEVLQLIPGIDSQAAQAIVSARAGASGILDPNVGPFVSLDPNYLWARVPGMSLEAARQLQAYCDIRSRTFQVTVTAEVGGYSRDFIAVLARNSPNDIRVLTFYGK